MPFPGMANHLGEFTELSTPGQPLCSLLVKGTAWALSDTHQLVFDASKSTLSNYRVLATHSPDRETLISADVSSFGLGATPQHRGADDSILPVGHQSCSLTSAGAHFSQIERKRLPQTWACDRFSAILVDLLFTISIFVASVKMRKRCHKQDSIHCCSS